jgi:multidrug resistance protein MdtO
VAIACAVAVEYIFGTRSPAERLEDQFRMRYRALEEMFDLYAQDATPKQRYDAGVRVSRLAAAGHGG